MVRLFCYAFPILNKETEESMTQKKFVYVVMKIDSTKGIFQPIVFSTAQKARKYYNQVKTPRLCPYTIPRKTEVDYAPEVDF